MKRRGLFSIIFDYAGAKKKYYVFSIITSLISVTAGISPFYFIASIINKLIEGRNEFSAYSLDSILLLVLFFLKGAFHIVSTSLSHIAAYQTIKGVRKRAIDSLALASLGDVKSHNSGSLKNTLCERIDSTEVALAHIIPEFTGNIIGFLGTFIYLMIISWQMGLIALIPFTIGMVSYLTMSIGYEKYWNNCINKTKVLNDTAVEYINGIEVIKAFGKSESSYKKFKKAAKEGADCFVEWQRKCNIAFSIAMTVAPYTLLAVLPLGGILYYHGMITLEVFVISILMSVGLISPLINSMGHVDDLHKAKTIFSEIDEIVSMDHLNRPSVSKNTPKDSSISLKGVSFGYEDKEVLHNINLDIKANSQIALVGPSGAGKSTIAKLIASLWDPNKGDIYIGGVNIKDLTLEDYNKMVSYVSQNNYLFNVSILENIKMGNLNATDEDVIAVCKKCGIHDFIMNLENGYNTIVGDSGSHLSGGERQRISIARAMMKDSKIVILDEATAYTDPENEAIIQKSLSALAEDKTVIVIAHRLSTIIHSDDIILVNDGIIEAHGKHEELLEKSELYKNMWLSHIAGKDSDLNA
ncbi:ATP-binding cassette subfamily B protein [Anaeroplasma bactoclasticum]|jgi:ATP-binding cassette subfamily B protein|uniref:ATP-binding cassette subfamily B protein n=1 Tax=Anaeroplasma bactoclasticum TaxID=2088 RepID=A0A397RW10_9MOLU|nr:ABC transporter ATP-binding protein [Anaeroplasma bactoclasticum]RIA78530.1 ATP-binding cassette subfamily B protein [Anaeroplasma bactoclasticum]